jgi:hypothetical protein
VKPCLERSDRNDEPSPGSYGTERKLVSHGEGIGTGFVDAGACGASARLMVDESHCSVVTIPSRGSTRPERQASQRRTRPDTRDASE